MDPWLTGVNINAFLNRHHIKSSWKLEIGGQDFEATLWQEFKAETFTEKSLPGIHNKQKVWYMIYQGL